MASAMYAGFWLFFPFLWTGQLGDMGVMMCGHVAMPVLMLLAVLTRRRGYAVPCHRIPPDCTPAANPDVEGSSTVGASCASDPGRPLTHAN
jgi:hypothetical protein